ncbi:MAG TPA: oligosaccharide flippase family protein [Deltaproteobacteria bacterium]|nr:oligosaccharide flippase family protein [Deltaproteobacteria bacterium]
MGEAVSRLTHFLVIAFIARKIGAEALGYYAIAQTISQYVLTATDLGTRSIGTRMVATHHGSAGFVVTRVVRRRLSLAALCIPCGLIYALWGPIPEGGRLFVLLFILSIFPDTLTLDWLLLGLERFWTVGIVRAIMALLFTAISIVGIILTSGRIYPVAWANFLSMAAAAILIGLVWYFLLHPHEPGPAPGTTRFIRQEFLWKKAGWLSGATILNQTFSTLDVLLLGALTTATAVGYYNAAYKIIFLIFAVYSLFNQAVFPTIARLPQTIQNRRSLFNFIGLLGIAGAAVTVLLFWIADDIILLVYGHGFDQAVSLLRILLYVVPLALGSSLLGTIQIAWGMSRHLLISTGLGLIVNIGMNLYLIPLYGATGAAWSVIAAYLVMLMSSTILFFAADLSEA